MTIVGLNYGFAGPVKLDEVTGGRPLRRHHDHRRRTAAQPSETNSPARAIKTRDRGNCEKNCMADAIPGGILLKRCRPYLSLGDDGHRYGRTYF